jgi:primosomal protein N'
VFGGIYVCEECIDKILALHVSTNLIKTLCPYCYEKEGNVNKCPYCDIKSLDDSV